MKSVDIIRADMFMKKNKRENKVIDLSTMPPSFSSLFLHLQHADYVARIWKLTLCASLSYLISTVVDGMKMVESNGYKNHFLMISLNCWCLTMPLRMIQEICFRTMAVISRVILKKMKVGSRSKISFPNMCCKSISLWKVNEFL